jgi:MFS family permease
MTGSFRLLWFGEGVSVLGNATSAVLLPLAAVLQFHAGPGWLGLLTAAAWLPWLVVGLPAGAWVDHLHPRSVMIASDLVAAALVASIPAAQAMHRLSLGQLLAVALGSGVCTVFFRTAYVKLLPEVVDESGLELANARLFGTESAMQVLGPGAAGTLLRWVSAATGLALDAASFLVSALCLWRVRPRHQPAAASRRAPLGEQIREGVRFVWRDRYLRWLTAIGGLSNFGLTGYAALLVLYLVRDLRLAPASVGTVLMLGSVGGLLGSVVATRVTRRLGSGRASTVLFVCAGPPALLIPLAGPGLLVGVAVAGLLLVGVFVVAGNVVRAAWRQRYVPHELMGRVVTASQVVNYGTMPLAGLTAGWLGGQLGVRPTIALMAAVHAGACASILASPLRGQRDLPERSEPPRVPVPA